MCSNLGHNFFFMVTEVAIPTDARGHNLPGTSEHLLQESSRPHWSVAKQ
jgi:hypothetical protein